MTPPFINGMTCAVGDDGTTWLIVYYQEVGQEKPVEVARFVMSETTALMLADGITNTHRQAKQKKISA